ncbi:MAG: hypothetical protein HZB62_12545 [Nitrospirae bacterium]|nr:hypothetical protein [Nitrospirota bacterium]
MEIEYAELRSIATALMLERRLAGQRPRRRRRKPRDPEKVQLLMMKNRHMTEKFPPAILEDGSLVLPYLSRGDLL